MRKAVLMVLIGLFGVAATGQTEEEISKVLRFIGVMELEEADGEEVERLVDILRHPVRINYASRSKLESSGLFTPFQIASLEDYILRHGDILSLTELSVIDGFTSIFAGKLNGFVSFESAGLNSESKGIVGEIGTRSALKKNKGEHLLYNYALRGKCSINDVWGMSISGTRAYDADKWYPSVYSGNFFWQHRRGQFVVGDFNARFGQGLCMWNTMTISSLTSPSSFMKRSSGLSPSYSFTGNYAMTGVAGDVSMGRWKVSALMSLPRLKTGSLLELQPVANVTRYFSFGHIGLTHNAKFSDIWKDFRIPAMNTSADFSICLRGVNVFGESVHDWISQRLSALVGIETSLGEKTSLASMIRYLPSGDEYGAAMSFEYAAKRHNVVVSSDGIYHPSGKKLTEGEAVQLKCLLRWKWTITDCLYSEIRVSERLRTWGQLNRTDLRADLQLDFNPWTLAMRLNMLSCVQTGLLGYLEMSCKGNKGLKIYLRQGVFKVDNWDDRIYVYERDAPGNFNVPAFYGRGVWTSAYMSWRATYKSSLYVRFNYTAYPFMYEKKKPGKAELKFLYVLQF